MCFFQEPLEFKVFSFDLDYLFILLVFFTITKYISLPQLNFPPIWPNCHRTFYSLKNSCAIKENASGKLCQQ